MRKSQKQPAIPKQSSADLSEATAHFVLIEEQSSLKSLELMKSLSESRNHNSNEVIINLTQPSLQRLKS